MPEEKENKIIFEKKLTSAKLAGKVLFVATDGQQHNENLMKTSFEKLLTESDRHCNIVRVASRGALTH
ncbi:hypothetical protein [Bacillus sp. KH172YL63]|uniref:hypothetical protein n=1 Tax=Bacillus sp. KH172YL63 TaxID=2709784 RepID=UPI0013E44CFC|nr:hypothetical protein [Bacillus sp. KH172YL63]BCB05809.1 hypothetical protein KH172YL63_39420 [Bacillus sp. KH172YL63]